MTDRFVCTASYPWRIGFPTPAVHPAAHEVGEQRDGYPSGDRVSMLCEICGTRWEMELAQ